MIRNTFSSACRGALILVAALQLTAVACGFSTPGLLEPVGGQARADAQAMGAHRETAGDLDWDDDEPSGASADRAGRSGTPLASFLFLGDGRFPSYPLPDGNPEPLGPAVFGSGFRDPLPLSPVWNPPGPKRVGLQVGHWLATELPHELRRLSPGASAGGWAEWELNALIAQRAARLLEDAGVEVDVLPSVIPIRYRAHAFVAIHADGDTSGRMSGYKIARPGFSSIPETDDEMVRVMYEEYGAATGMAQDADAHISRRMIYYYAFNTRRYQHALDLGTPAAIIETGFLTNAGDRTFLTSRPELAARGIANGVLRFLDLERGANPTR